MTQLFTFVDDTVGHADTSLSDGVYMIEKSDEVKQLVFINRPMPQSYYQEIASSGYRIITWGPLKQSNDQRCFYSYVLRNG